MGKRALPNYMTRSTCISVLIGCLLCTEPTVSFSGERYPRKVPIINYKNSRLQLSSHKPDPSLPEANPTELSELSPPSVNLSRRSILFDEHAETERSNLPLSVWQFLKAKSPPLLTGAWSWRSQSVADTNPIMALYNVAFVRLPTICLGIVYGKNLLSGQPLIMDFGDGPFVMSPILVLVALAIILA